MNERRGNPPFQFRLDPELRKAMEEAQRQDGDESLAAWIKRVIRKRAEAERDRSLAIGIMYRFLEVCLERGADLKAVRQEQDLQVINKSDLNNIITDPKVGNC